MQKIKIIAEAGVNHNGDIDLAKKLVDHAVHATADCVKFQSFKAAKLSTKSAGLAEYQKLNVHRDEGQYEMLKRLELSYEEHVELKKYCSDRNIEFISTPFDVESLKMLIELDCNTLKISSGDLTNKFLLEEAGRNNKQTILSTGMANEIEIQEAINCLFGNGLESEKLTLLHCTTEYPCPKEEVNLRAMVSMKRQFCVNTGYSDHTTGIEIAIAAAALGASVIEKHFTLSRDMDGPDHEASLEPLELRQMVCSIRSIEIALGDGKKTVTSSEQKNVSIARKSLVAKRDIKKGEIFTRENLAAKRPGSGISPMLLDTVNGEVAKRDFSSDELIEV